jgi:hypothetical protein
MSNTFFNFNNVEKQANYPLIPDGTLVKVRLDIKQGGYNNTDEGWDSNMATLGQSGAVYLKCEYKILSGTYKGQKVFSLIGLHSQKSPLYQQMGRALILGILESSRGVYSKDRSDEAIKKRQISSLSDLDNLTFIAEISIGKDMKGEPKNEIKKAITPDHPEYYRLMKDDQEDGNSPF